MLGRREGKEFVFQLYKKERVGILWKKGRTLASWSTTSGERGKRRKPVWGAFHGGREKGYALYSS